MLGLLRDLVDEGHAGARQQSHKEDELAHRARRSDERDRQAAQGVPDEHEIVVGLRDLRQNDLGVGRAPGLDVIAGQIDRDRGMPVALDLGDETFPAPGSMPGTVHQRERRHPSPLSPRGQPPRS